MRTKIDWPPTGRDIPGMMGFSAEWDDYTAGHYKRMLIPLITTAVVKLENEIDILKAENEALRKVVEINKLKVKYCHETGNWIVIKEISDES